MKKKITGFLVNPYTHEAKRVEFRDELDELYRLLDVRTIDIVTRRVAGLEFTIVCDDEGLLIDRPRPSAIDESRHAMLVGPLLFTAGTHGEDLEGLTDDDVKILTRSVGHYRIDGDEKPVPVIVGMDF